MNPDRAIAIILALSLVVVLLLGAWLLRRAHREPEPAPATPTMTAQPSVAPTATPGVAAAPASAHGYRLAGTVVGDLSYAIIEDPSGVNQLYRPGQAVPGLGEIVEIEADRITLAGSGGTFVLQLAPAPTTTPTTLPRKEPSAAQPSSAATPGRRPPRDRSGFESSP